MDAPDKPGTKHRISAPSHHKRPPRRQARAVTLPPPPPELSASAAREWRRIAPGLVLLGADFVLDQAMILNYVQACGDLENVRSDWTLRGSPSVVIRPAGERPHPDIATMRALAADVARYADRLGLSARSRKVLDIAIGPIATEPPAVVGAKRDRDPASRFFDD